VKSVKEPQQLTTMLTGLLSKDYTESEPQKKGLAIRSHIGGLFLTFFIVLVSWSIYSGRQLSLINISTPIVYRNIPDNLELVKTSAEQVEVQITGRRHLVSALKKEQVGAVIDLKDKTGGSYELILTPNNINLPLGLDVVRITPSTLSMVFEQRIVKKLSVKPRFTGLLPSGYRIKNISVKPEFVNVNGSATVLRDINSLFTETIDLDKLKPQNGEKTVDVPIIISPSSLRLISGQGQIAKVSISLNSLEVDSEKPQPSTTSLYHRVTEGETLWDISQRYNVPVDRIRYLNKISLSETIYPDQMLIINP
jgi:YbbR domain-containing protein